jgi:DNA repair exonuclease SbcCD nuclease subunit
MVGGHQIDFLPFVHDPIDHLKTLQQERESPKILIGHLAIHGAELHSVYHNLSDVVLEHDGEMVKVTPELFSFWDKVFLGHYHSPQIIKNIEYIGSPLELNFGEAYQEKHMILYDLVTGEQEYIVNDFSPKHLVLTEDEVEDQELENNFVRVNVVNAKSIEILGLRKNIQEKKPGTLEIIQKPKKEEKQVVEDAKSILNNEDEMLDTYVKEVETGDLDKVRLLEIGKNICRTPVN